MANGELQDNSLETKLCLEVLSTEHVIIMWTHQHAEYVIGYIKEPKQPETRRNKDDAKTFCNKGFQEETL